MPFGIWGYLQHANRIRRDEGPGPLLEAAKITDLYIKTFNDPKAKQILGLVFDKWREEPFQRWAWKLSGSSKDRLVCTVLSYSCMSFIKLRLKSIVKAALAKGIAESGDKKCSEALPEIVDFEGEGSLHEQKSWYLQKTPQYQWPIDTHLGVICWLSHTHTEHYSACYWTTYLASKVDMPVPKIFVAKLCLSFIMQWKLPLLSSLSLCIWHDMCIW